MPDHVSARVVYPSNDQSEDSFRLLVHSVKDYAIFMLDPGGHVASWNEGAQRIKGYQAEEILGKHFSIFYEPEPVARGWPEYELQVAQKEGRFEDEGWRVRKDGSKFWADVVITALFGSDGQLRGFAKVTRDLTERKRAEEEMRRLNHELQLRLVQLGESNRVLAQKSEENETFIYSVSHDVRSPLVNLQGFSQEMRLSSDELEALLKDEAIPEHLRHQALEILNTGILDSVKYIQSAVLHLSNIVDGLLRLSRAGRVEYQWAEVDLNKVVQRILESMNDLVQKRGVKVTVDPLPLARGDTVAIEQLFSNLLSNALNYLDRSRKGEIHVGALAPEDGVQTYFVRDNGLGMTELAQSKLFTAFQRFHPESAKGEGIGLALVRRIVERLKGKIWVESEVSRGTTFYVSLPAVQPAS